MNWLKSLFSKPEAPKQEPPVEVTPPRWGGQYRIVELTFADGSSALTPQHFFQGRWYGPGEYFFVPPRACVSLATIEAFLDERWASDLSTLVVSTRQVLPNG